MNKYLITPTLLNSYWYYVNSSYKSDNELRGDFLKKLSREKFEPTESMIKGNEFERMIRHNSDIDESYKDVVAEIGNIVDGGMWQLKCSSDFNVPNINYSFFLYGRMDVVKKNYVYDIKYASNYEVGKFSESAQHLIYLYCTGLPNFSYLISDGKNFWKEDYFNHTNIKNEISSRIVDFMTYLENDNEAKNIYFKKWSSKIN